MTSRSAGCQQRHVEARAGIRLVNEMAAAAEVQTQLQAQEARRPSRLSSGKAGDVDIDSAESQGCNCQTQDEENYDR